MKLIGVGFGRTGTFSVKAALERLGHGPCYHMKEVLEDPARIQQWLAIARGDPANWPEIFDGYASTMDWPAVAYWRELTAYYADAKVLLTVRDAERWQQSAEATIFRYAGRVATPTGRLVDRALRWWNPEFDAFSTMVEQTVHQRDFGGDVVTKAHLIDVFERHNVEVMATIPAERLLVYDVAQGWGPLCAFLEVPVPEEDFPRVNDSAAFQENSRARMKGILLRRPATGLRS